MAITVGTDSYVTVAEADTYLATRLDTSAWDALSTADKETHLKAAWRDIDRQHWSGYLTDPDQAQAWPRNGESTVPQEVEDAQCEQALWLVRERYRRQDLARDGVTSYAVGGLSEQLQTRQRLAPEALDLLGGWVVLAAAVV